MHSAKNFMSILKIIISLCLGYILAKQLSANITILQSVNNAVGHCNYYGYSKFSDYIYVYTLLVAPTLILLIHVLINKRNKKDDKKTRM